MRVAVDRLFEDVARAEGGDRLGRDLHLLPGLRVPALPGLALLDIELAEARDLDLLTILESRGDHVLDRLDVALGLAFRAIGLFGYPLDKLRLVHGCSSPPPVKVPSSGRQF